MNDLIREDGRLVGHLDDCKCQRCEAMMRWVQRPIIGPLGLRLALLAMRLFGPYAGFALGMLTCTSMTFALVLIWGYMR